MTEFAAPRFRDAVPARVAEARPQRRRSDEKAPFLAALVVVAVFLPEALGFFFFGLRLTPARAVLLVLTPVMLFSFGSLLGSARYRLVLSDLLMPAALVWMIISLAQIDGIEVALKSGGVTGLEILGPYLLMRCVLCTPDEVHATVKLLSVIAAIAGPIGVADTFAHFAIIHDQLARLTGYTYYHNGMLSNLLDNYRLGLYRAQGIFEHPILYGIIMCYSLLLTLDLNGRLKPICRLGCGFGLFLSLSSAPWTGLILGLGLWFYLRFAPFSYRWLVLTGMGALASAIFFMVMPNPFGWLFNHLTLDPSTGYFRLLIWQYAGHDVMRSPIFGIGVTHDWFRPDWMPSSVDSLWLSSAMSFGIPGSVLIGFAILGAGSLRVVRTRANSEVIGPREVKLSRVLGILTFLTIYLGFTVDYWGASFMIIGLLAGIRAVLGQLAKTGNPIAGATR